MFDDEIPESDESFRARLTVLAEEPRPPWLIVIDMQPIFGDPSSQWCATGFEAIVAPIVQLVERFADRVMFTRYIPPAAPRGSWIPYFEQWRFAFVDQRDALYGLVEPFPDYVRHISSRESFGKWDESMHSEVSDATGIVLVGVATECCVLATALAAADAGMFVRVVVDACAGGTTRAHEAALEIMGLYAPQITLTTVDEVLASLPDGPVTPLR